MAAGIFIISELEGSLRQQVVEIQRRFDPKLAKSALPHVTITGSSGVGPLPMDLGVPQLRKALEPIAETTEPIVARFGLPTRFMQTQVVVLPLDPHGALRTLHERIAGSGLVFAPARFFFTPHCTLSLHRTLTPSSLRELLAVRIEEPVVISRIQVYRTNDPQPSRKLLDLELTGHRITGTVDGRLAAPSDGQSGAK